MAISFCSIRVEKKKATKVSAIDSHNRRLDSTEVNIAHSISHLNQSMISNPDDLSLDQLMQNRMQKLDVRSVKKNASVLLELVVSASPEYFRENPNAWGEYDQEKLEAWRDATFGWLKEKYGDNLLQCELHLDEKTPHFHATVLPICEKELKHRRTKAQIAAAEPAKTYTAFRLDADSMTKKSDYYNLQDEYSEAVKHLGIERGIHKSKATHKTLREYGARLIAEHGQEIHPNIIQNMTVPKPEKGMNWRSYAKLIQNKIHDFYAKRINHLVDMVDHLKIRNNDVEMQLKTEKARTAMYASQIHSPGEIDLLVERAAQRVNHAENRSEKLEATIKSKDEQIEELEGIIQIRDEQIDMLKEPEKPIRRTHAQTTEMNR